MAAPGNFLFGQNARALAEALEACLLLILFKPRGVVRNIIGKGMEMKGEKGNQPGLSFHL